MNRLSSEKRRLMIQCLVAGMSIRAASRTAGTSKNTTLKPLVDAESATSMQVRVPCSGSCRSVTKDSSVRHKTMCGPKRLLHRIFLRLEFLEWIHQRNPYQELRPLSSLGRMNVLRQISPRVQQFLYVSIFEIESHEMPIHIVSQDYALGELTGLHVDPCGPGALVSWLVHDELRVALTKMLPVVTPKCGSCPIDLHHVAAFRRIACLTEHVPAN